MRKIITTFIFIFLACNYVLHAQVDCSPTGSIKLNDVKDYCSGKAGESNVNVTPNATGPIPNCWNTNSKNDVWYKFTAIASDVTINVVKNGANGTIKNVNIAFYSTCATIDICKVGTAADTLTLYKGGLTIGNTYFFRISSTATDAGTYTLCVKNTIPPQNPSADCDKAVKLCSKDKVKLPGLSGPGKDDKEIETSSCFHSPGASGTKFTEQNSCWYYWVCGKSGTLTFDLTPLDPLGDLDFIVYELNGTNICATRNILRCCGSQCKPGNKTGLNMTETDVSEEFSFGNDCNTVKNEYVKYIDMQVGKTYALFVNDATQKSGFTIDFGGTGEFQAPEAKLEADKLSICEGESITFKSNSLYADSVIWNISPGATPATVPPNTAGPHVITYNTPGNYTVTLIAKSLVGCYSTQVVNITVSEAPTVTIVSKEICEGDQATLTATPSVPGGTYSWSPGGGTGPTLNASPTADQTYTVTYKLAGCESTGMGTITVNKKPEVTVNSVDICAGTDAILTATLKETTGTYTYLWSTGGQTKSITVSPTVKTTYTVTVKSAQGCEGIGTGTVDINGTLSVNAGNDTTICEGATVKLLVKPNAPGYTYKWTASTGTVSDPAIFNPTATPTETTTYTVDVTSDKGCAGSDVVIVSIDPLMTPALTPTNVTCNAACDGKASVSVIGGTAPYTYSWNGGCDKALCTSLCVGTYTVTVKDKIGCVVTGNTTITEPTAIVLQTSSVSSICGKPNGSATVIASGGAGTYTYQWDDPAKQTTATANGLLSKKYCVTVTDANGCKKTACIDVLDKPGITASPVSVTPVSCNGFCDGTAEVTVTGGSAPYTYSWNTTPGAQTNAKATGLCAGNYIATVTDVTGCTDTVQVKVTQPQPITLEPVPPVTICIGSNATIKAVGNGGDGNYTYSWLPESTETTSAITVFPVVSTDYHVIIKDGKGCPSAPLIIKVNVNPPLKVVASNDVSLCINDSAKLTANGSGGNGGPYTYTWTPTVAQTGNNITVKPLVSTTYTVTIKDNCGTPAATDTVRVNINASPVIKFAADTVQGCSPLTVNFTDSTTVTGGVITSWKWDFGDKSGSDSKNPTHVFTTTGVTTSIYTVTLTVKSSNGCVATMIKKDMIRVFPVPVADFVAPISNSILNPTVHFTNTSVGATSWSWDFGDTLCTPVNNISTMYSPNHTYSEIGEYCVKLIVKNVGGCTSDVTKCITIDPQFVLYIPNAFTPNGDGDNDYFYAKGEYINDFEMRIFDRWGNMFYYADRIDEPWNGKKNNIGEIAQQDVYVYQITIKDNKNKRHKYVGTVTLVKGG